MSSRLETMYDLGLLTEPQYLEIRAWVNSPLTLQDMKAMPQPLWTALARANLLLTFDPEEMGLYPS